MAPDVAQEPVSVGGLAVALNALCDTTQSDLVHRLQQQHTRLVRCERSLQQSVDAHRLQAHTFHAQLDGERQAIETLEAHNSRLQQQLQQEQHERREEKEWLVQLWPDGLVLPTLLKPLEALRNEAGTVTFRSVTAPSHDVNLALKRLHARINRRVARELVRQQIEAAQQWQIIVEPSVAVGATDSTSSNDTESVLEPPRVYFVNSVTGESVWEPPAAMTYEPPLEWNTATNDWDDNYGIEYFYDSASSLPLPVSSRNDIDANNDDSSNDDDDDHAVDDTQTPTTAVDDVATPNQTTIRRNTAAGVDGNDSDDNDDDEDEPPGDPVALRAEMTLAFAHHAQLQQALATSESQQRTLALQLLNANRAQLEHERDALALEDDAKRDAERTRRRAQQKEEAAARVKAAAIEQKKSSTAATPQPTFAKDSVGKKDLMLAKDDEQLERELDEFVLAQRADRLYLTLPLSLEPRVQRRHQLDVEFVHMTHMETAALAIEQLEFALLEKTERRAEDAATTRDACVARCDDIRMQQQQVTGDLASVKRAIEQLEAPLLPPSDARPSADDLERASKRFVTLTPPVDDDHQEGGNDDSDNSDNGSDVARAPTTLASPTAIAMEAALSDVIAVDTAALLQDEAELVALKHFVDCEQRWCAWEREETMRIDELAAARARLSTLEQLQQQLACARATAERDAPFLTQLATLEQALNARLWVIQATSQTERARFLIERATRDEAVVQLRDRLVVLHEQHAAAARLPLQALSPLDRLRLEQASKVACTALATQASELQTALDKELQAKALLLELETRASAYTHAKLDEEMALFHETQTLLALSVTLADELEALVAPNSDAAAVAVADSLLDAKCETLQHVREFLLRCYEREARWRQLAAVALVKDTSSHEWMTSAQHERHARMQAMQQVSHKETLQTLTQQLEQLERDKRALQIDITDVQDRLVRVQLAYQRSSDYVRAQTQSVIAALTTEIAQLDETLQSERLASQAERERLIHSHDVVRTTLDARVLALEETSTQQRHWLTAATRELHAQRIANQELVKAYGSLEKRRAAETNDMRFRITAQVAKINSIEMWNAALTLQAQQAQHARIAQQQAIDDLVHQHKQQQRLLRLQNWRQRVAAQAVLSDVDLLVRFFVDGIDVLAGATRATNAALRANGGIEVLAALTRHCAAQPHVRAVCARALGLLAWNANATPRALGWRAKRKWFTWVTTQSDAALAALEATVMTEAFDAVADEASTAVNWLADPSVLAGESDAEYSSSSAVATTADDAATAAHSKKLRFVHTWHQLDELEFPDANVDNQEHMALSPGVLQTLLDLCHAPNTQRSVVGICTNADNDDGNNDSDATQQLRRNALQSLALVVLQARNTSIVGRMDGCIELLVSLVAPRGDDDLHVVRSAVLALGHLAFANANNQCAIARAGAVPHLLALCASATSDVDLVVAATQTLAYVAHSAPVPVCAALVDAGAVHLLAQLCHSPRIYDAVELDVFEQVQTHAAQIIASIVAALESIESECDDRAQSVADAILAEEERVQQDQALQSSASNGDVSSKSKRASPRFGGSVTSFVLMCASCNRDVALHAALVLGSIAQHDAIRAAIGRAGGIDALFLLADQRESDNNNNDNNSNKRDVALVQQATWALANLTWNRDNQYRVARYMESLYALCVDSTTSSAATRRQSVVRSNQESPVNGSSSSNSNSNSKTSLAQPEHDSDSNNADSSKSQLDADAMDADTIADATRAIHEHALCILANALFYNDANRQLVATQRKWMALLQRECVRGDGAALEHAARALCALSYSDAVALAMGVPPAREGANATNSAAAAVDRPLSGLEVFVRLCGRTASPLAQRHGLFGVINLCLHDVNKTRLLDVPHGIDMLVNLSGATDPELRDPALEALELLSDVRALPRSVVASGDDSAGAGSSARAFAATDMKALVALLQDAATSPAVIAMVSDAIADAVWQQPSAQVKLRNAHGLNALLALCVQPSSASNHAGDAIAIAQQHRLRISCLWALRNTVRDNVRNQDVVGAIGGVEQLVLLYDRLHHRTNDTNSSSDDMVEAILATLAALVQQHARNSQQLVQFGLDMLLTLADSSSNSSSNSSNDRGVVLPLLTPGKLRASTTTTKPARRVDQQPNATLARELLHLVAPYNTAQPPPLPTTTTSPDKLTRMRRSQQQPQHQQM